MKKQSLILLCALALFSLLTSAWGNSLRPARVEEGVLDLSERHIPEDGYLRLDGQWEFYWMSLLEPDDFLKKSPLPQKEFIDVPGAWNDFRKGGRAIGGEGFATYRLRIILPEKGGNYGLKIRDMGTAFRFWVNGRLLAKNGTVGTSRETMRPQFLPGIVFFKTETDTVEVVVQVSNFFDRKGGMWHTLFFGRDDSILALREWSVAMESALMGILVIMALYHMGLFVLRRKDPSALYFSLYCLIICLRTFLLGERLFIELFPNFNWELELKLEHMTFYLGVPVFGLFIRSLYKEEISRMFVRILVITGFLFTAVLLITPARIHTLGLTAYQVITIAAIIYCIITLVRASLENREGAVFILAGFIVLAASVINDFLYDLSVLRTGYLVSWGLFAFIFFQSIVISMRFSRAFSNSEALSEELAASKIKIEDYNATLETQVSERTDLIRRQNIFLEEQIAMAESLQRTLLPDSVQSIPNGRIGYSYEPMMGVGGDFIDIALHGKELGLFICDVSGHGVAGAFLASMVKMSLNQWHDNPGHPAETLEFIQRSLEGKLGSYFISASACFVDLDGGIARIANAGHPDTIILRGDGSVERINPGGRIISDLFATPFEEKEIHLEKSDRIVLYTDGIIETRNHGKEMFGEDRFVELIGKLRRLEPDDFCRTVITEVKGFSGISARLEDDITLLVLEYL